MSDPFRDVRRVRRPLGSKRGKLMSDETTCTHCDARPAHQSYLCKPCTTEARRALWWIGYLVEHLDGARARMKARDYGASGGRSAETPIPYDPRVSRRYIATSNALIGMHKQITEHRGLAPDVSGFTLRQLAFWIGGNIEALALMPQAGDEVRVIEGLYADLDGFFSRPPDSYWLGLCKAPTEDGECPTDLYVEVKDSGAPASDFVTCPHCAAQLEVRERQNFIAEALNDHLATMRELVRLAPLIFPDDPTSRRQLGRHVQAGNLRPSGHRVSEANPRTGDMESVDTYRIGAAKQAAALWESSKRPARVQRHLLRRAVGT